MGKNTNKNLSETETDFDLMDSSQINHLNYENSIKQEAVNELYATEKLETINTDMISENHSETIYKNAARWVLLFGITLMPLFFLPWTTSVLELNKQLLLTIVAGVGLVLWLLDVVMSGKISWNFNPLDKGILGFAGAVVLSSIFSVAKFKSVFGLAGNLSGSLFSIIALTLIYLLLINTFDEKGSKLRLYFSVSITAAILYGLLQILGVHIVRFPFAVSRSFNMLGSINGLGMMAAIMLPVLYTQKKFKNKYFNYGYLDISKIGALASLVVLLIINWWVLWVVAITSMVAMIILESFVFSSHRGIFRISKFIFPMVVIVLGIFMVIVNMNFIFVKRNLPIELAPSNKLSAKVAWEVLKDNFAFGYGPENFSLAFDKYGAQEFRKSSFSGLKLFDATSYVFNTIINSGLLGLFALGFIFWLIGSSLFKTVKQKLIDFDPESIGIISAVAASIVAMFFYPFNLILVFNFYILLALLVLAVWSDKRFTYNVEEKAVLSMVSSLGFISGLILALVGLYFVSVNYIADVKFAKALGQTEVKNASDRIVNAINWKDNDDRFYKLASQLSLNLLSQELNTKANPNDTQKNYRTQNHITSAVAMAQKATQVAPRESNNWLNLGNVYQNLMRLVDGADSLAESAYLKASELRPGDPSFQNQIGSMYIAKADLIRQLAALSNASVKRQFGQQLDSTLKKAEESFKKAIDLSNNYGLAIYNLGVVYERQGKLNEAIKQLETIAPFNSNQPGLAFELGLLYYRANRKDDSFAQLQRALVLAPDYANARWYLALIYEETKRLDQAIEQLERILSIDVNKNNKVILEKLKDLKAGKTSIPPNNVLDQKPL